MPTASAREYAIWPKDRTVTVSDGTPIAYTVVGDGNKTPILFVNGWTCSDAYWVDIGPGMVEDGHPVIFVDTRGHGESGLPRDPGFLARNLRKEDVTTERLARDVLEVVEDAGLDSVALSGHSLGVQIIVEACRLAPDTVAALMPVAGTFENPVKTFADLGIFDRIYPVADIFLGLFPFAFLKPFNKGFANPETGLKMVKLIRVAGPKVTAERLAPHLRQIVELDFSVLFKMMGEQRKHSTADFLPTITAPTLILAGRRDLFTPPSVQQKMADLIPDSEIVWFPDGGHMLPIEEPEGIVAAMLDFLDRRVDVDRSQQTSQEA
ncbi:MAG: Alpha/beta hydrolase fold precursor [Acidimicrobiales bacterium]|nr:Alpha/beta hydrolase fold precursor [Acidimicrobiales bacterium]